MTLYCRDLGDGFAEPVPLPFSVRTPSGIRTDLAGQLADQFITDADLISWGLLPFEDADAPSFDPRTERLVSGISRDGDTAKRTWTVESLTTEEQADRFEFEVSEKVRAVDAILAETLSVGYETGAGLHVAVGDGDRANMVAMATAAIAAMSGAVSWAPSYQAGWISIENIRIPLATPQDGLGLAAAVSEWYATQRQHARDLKDAILAAEDWSELDAVDIEDGW